MSSDKLEVTTKSGLIGRIFYHLGDEWAQPLLIAFPNTLEFESYTSEGKFFQPEEDEHGFITQRDSVMDIISEIPDKKEIYQLIGLKKKERPESWY